MPNGVINNKMLKGSILRPLVLFCIFLNIFTCPLQSLTLLPFMTIWTLIYWRHPLLVIKSMIMFTSIDVFIAPSFASLRNERDFLEGLAQPPMHSKVKQGQLCQLDRKKILSVYFFLDLLYFSRLPDHSAYSMKRLLKLQLQTS